MKDSVETEKKRERERERESKHLLILFFAREKRFLFSTVFFLNLQFHL